MEAEISEFAPRLNLKNNIIDFLQSAIVAITVCIVIYVVIATPNQIEGESMEPNFYNNEIVLTSKVHQWLGGTEVGKSIDLGYKHSDVIVFQKPGYSDFIKRIIAVGGDKIALKEGKIILNEDELNEDYLPAGTVTPGGTFLVEGAAPLTVPEGSYFVMGDNRSNSHDSRYSDIGFIKREWFKGKVLIRYWPLNKFEIVNK